MDIKDCIKSRRSIRRFKAEKISEETFAEILDLVRFAPSWNNSQTAKYILIENDDLKNKIADETTLDFSWNKKIIKNAPNLVVQIILTGISGVGKSSKAENNTDKWEVYDAGISAQTFSLVAHEKGYGTVILGIFDEKKVTEILDLSSSEKVAALIPIGIPDESPKPPK
ncbi:MAG: nitroreductase family protein, partial [Clostridiales Family XIII bacterium]|nr:nitroreductase family protein [Clostridiales Family XIII bacterium]